MSTAAPRTYLFVPGDRPDRFDKALASGADAVVLDLEDAVALADKPRARDAVALFLQQADAAARDRLVVRINDEATPEFETDLAMLARAGAKHLMLPKAERVATVARVPRRPTLPLRRTGRRWSCWRRWTRGSCRTRGRALQRSWKG